MKNMPDLGKVIRYWRVMSNKVLSEMSKSLEMEVHYLSGIETGGYDPTEDDLIKIASYLAGKDWKEEKVRIDENKRKFSEVFDLVKEIRGEK